MEFTLRFRSKIFQAVSHSSRNSLELTSGKYLNMFHIDGLPMFALGERVCCLEQV